MPTAMTSLFLLIAALVSFEARADCANSQAFDIAQRSAPACNSQSCASVRPRRPAPPKLPPWLMTRIASNARVDSACAIAALQPTRRGDA